MHRNIRLLGAVILGVGFVFQVSAQSVVTPPRRITAPAVRRAPTAQGTRTAMAACVSANVTTADLSAGDVDAVWDGMNNAWDCMITKAVQLNRVFSALNASEDAPVISTVVQQPTQPVTQQPIAVSPPTQSVQPQPIPSPYTGTRGGPEAFGPNYRGGLHFRDAFSSCMNEAGSEGTAAVQRIRVALNQNTSPAWGTFGGSIASKIAECEGRAGGGNYGGGATAGWINHTWYFKDGITRSSSILNRTDREYVDFIAAKDAETRTGYPSGENGGWENGGGDQSNMREFGIPRISSTPVSGNGTTVNNYSYTPSYDSITDSATCTSRGYYWSAGMNRCFGSREMAQECPTGSYSTGSSYGGYCRTDDGGMRCAPYGSQLTEFTLEKCTTPTYTPPTGSYQPMTTAQMQEGCTTSGGTWDAAQNYCKGMSGATTGGSYAGSGTTMTSEEMQANCTSMNMTWNNGACTCSTNKWDSSGKCVVAMNVGRTSLLGNAVESFRRWFSRP
ncbi:MAG: hypothetical protein Q7R63_00960 [bacterium]|nr:hypothetical protein [bacterium]